MPAEAAVAARTAPKRDAVRDIKENSPSKKLLRAVPAAAAAALVRAVRAQRTPAGRRGSPG